MLDRTIGNYKIVEKLGQGGMGVVYKALDIRLNRFLALKFLKPEEVTEDRRRRFHQEAKASSALNHPSIAHIYDIGEWEGSDFIAMEYVEGSTLHQMLQRGALPVDEALRYAIQVADAMSIAHAAGIVHRDLKPANVMVTPRGLVKILDFGVAKLTDLASDQHDSMAAVSTDTKTMADARLTVAGKVVGSPSHMSPEQAVGKPVDARSDIFAFGVLLQEMLTGKAAFSGRTALEVLSAILQVDPPKPSELNAAVTPELDWIVARCLRKDPDRRFQAMTEIKVALDDLRTTQSMSGIRASLPFAAAQTKKRSWALWAGFALALACAVGLGFALLTRRPAPSAKTSAPPEVTRLTTEAGLSIDPAISADGKLLAYASDRSGEGNMDIWVRQIDGGEAIRLTHNPADDVEPAFSPDGTKIVFRSDREGGGLYIIPTLGGNEYKIVNGGRQPQFSPDGTKIAYWKGLKDPYPLRQGHGQLFVLDLTQSNIRQVRADFAAAVHPTWSPDGKSILFMGLKDANDIAHTYDWWITPLGDGPAVMCPVLEFSPDAGFDPFAWRRDRVYFSKEAKDGRKIGEVTIDPKTRQPVGPPRLLTAGTTNEYSPSVSKDGRLVFSSIISNPDLYSLPLDGNRAKATGALERVTRDTGSDIVTAISTDGKKVSFLSDRTGATEVWVKDLGTGDERAITTGGKPKGSSFISPDGQFVAWRENQRDDHRIFLTPFSGGIPVQVCADCGTPTAWSADGRLLAYLVTPASQHWSAGLLEVSTRKPTEYLKDPRLDLVISSFSNDGKWLAFTAYRTRQDFSVYVAPFAPDHPPPQSEWVEVARSPDVRSLTLWSPDGNLLYFNSERDGHACVWAQRLDPATKRPRGALFAVQHFHALSLPLVPSGRLAVAKDKIVVTLNEQSGGIWMLKPAE